MPVIEQRTAKFLEGYPLNAFYFLLLEITS